MHVLVKYWQKKRIEYRLYDQLAVAVNMHQWKRARNICSRIKRVKAIQ